MKTFMKGKRMQTIIRLSKKGMELVQVAILIGIAVAVGIIFRIQITDFVNAVFDTLNSGGFVG